MTGRDKASEPKGRRVTMGDVATAAGVSQSTVSFVMNGQDHMRISAHTRRAVMEAAERLGYRPRAVGRPPASSRTPVFAVMIDEIATSPFGAISIDALQEEAWKAGALIEVAMTGGDPAYEAAMLSKWAHDRVDGVVYAAILTRRAEPPVALAKHRAVLLNCYDSAERYPSVVPAERRGGEAAATALIEAGRRRIAFISGEPWTEASAQRQEGFARALEADDIALDPDLVVEGNFLPTGGRRATERLLDLAVKPDAIFCANDYTAIGCYEALKAEGVKIGEDIAVIGYDDIELCQHMRPTLSSVLLPHREMGQWCARQLLANEAVKPEQVRLECPLVLRDSHQKGNRVGARHADGRRRGRIEVVERQNRALVGRSQFGSKG